MFLFVSKFFLAKLGDIIKLNKTFFWLCFASVALMETESSNLLDNQDGKLHGSPGYASLTTFTLKRAEVVDDPSGPVGPDNPSDLEISSLPSPFEIDDFASITRCLKLKQRPWIVYDQFHKEKEPDVKQRDMVMIVSS